MGFSLVYKGADGVVWMKSIPDFPYVLAGFVSDHYLSWVSSPPHCYGSFIRPVLFFNSLFHLQ
jgi:hypothetical protein